MKIYLVGYMGSGKSTVGSLLAQQLKMDFIDFDRFIEAEEQKTIAEIFDQHGEDHFRKLEHEYLTKTLDKKNVVISLGGGTPCFHNNMDLINKNGTSVYLEIDVESLVKRLTDAKDKRPLIRGLSEVELKYFIEANLGKRTPIYKNASLNVNATGKTTEQIIAEIRKHLAN